MSPELPRARVHAPARLWTPTSEMQPTSPTRVGEINILAGARESMSRGHGRTYARKLHEVHTR